MAKLHIEQWPMPVELGRGSILDAALDAGVPFPHGCMSGECGRCKCQLLGGTLRRGQEVCAALSGEEVASGHFLACRGQAQGDVHCRWLAEAVPAPAPRKLRARVCALERAAHDVMIVSLSSDAPLPFLPGQFARLRFGRLPPRAYSMANLPGATLLEFHVRVQPGGRVSGHVAHKLRVGDRVRIEGPFGDAHWRGAGNAPLLLLAGGTGLAPMVSVLDAALRDGQAPEQIHFYHGVRAPADLYAGARLRERAQQMGFRFEAVFSDGTAGRHLHEALERDFPCLKQACIYVAGPPPMVEAVRRSAGARGTPDERIHADAFHAAAPVKRRWWQLFAGG